MTDVTDPIGSLTLAELLERLAAKTPAPGGGAAAAAAGALAAAIAGMVVSYSVGKDSLARHGPLLEGAARSLANARALLLGLADEDAAAYSVLNRLMRLPEADPRRAELPGAVGRSLEIPRATAAACMNILRLLEDLAGKTNRRLWSDLAIAAELACAGIRASRWNIEINALQLSDAAARERAIEEAARAADEALERSARLAAACRPPAPPQAGTTRLEEAVAAYRLALVEHTRERVPLDWAATQNNLGNALRALGERESGTARLVEAVAAYRLALGVYEAAGAAYYIDLVKRNLAIAERLLAARPPT